MSAFGSAGNRLGDSGSLYLRQHASNPVAWCPWDGEALARARERDLPIFLSIGYASCHWCHVMESEVFDDEAVAALLNDRFVCIKVDREERPDLDAAYMAAVQAMAGGGGWPLSVFLTPGLEPFYGGTYIPREQFADLCQRIDAVWHERRGDVARRAAGIAAAVASSAPPTGGAAPDEAALAEIVERGLVACDPEHGGFGRAPKFPTPVRWRFLLHWFRRTGDLQVVGAVRRALDAMALGGIRDHLGGGFHRYATDAVWSVPHFEIMLYDNAQLASLYLEAGTALDEPRYQAVARDVLDFLLRDMRLDDGTLAASFDADSGGEEGSFYLWAPEEIADVAGPHDGPLLAELLGVGTGGVVDGRCVLDRRTPPAAVAARTGRDPGETAALFARHREALRARRAARPAPARDPKVVTAWNGLALSALARAAAQLDEPRYREAAVRLADRLWDVQRDDRGRLARATTGGVRAGEGILDDYACFAGGLLDLHEAGGGDRSLERALELLATAQDLFDDGEDCFALTAGDVDAPLGRRRELFDSVEPSGASELLHALLRASALTDDAPRRAVVESCLRRHGPLIAGSGLEMAWWADAALMAAGPFRDVVIAGDPQAASTRMLIDAYWSVAPPWAVLTTVPAAGAGPGLSELMPGVVGKTATGGGRATAYACRFGACDAPTSEPGDLVEQLRDAWSV